MSKFKKKSNIINDKSKKIRPTSLASRIVTLFAVFIFIVAFATNYINLNLNSYIMIDLMKELLIKDLKTIYNYSNNQFEIFQFNNDKDLSLKNISDKAKMDFKNDKSIALGVNKDGSLLFVSSNPDEETIRSFSDKKVLQNIINNKKNNKYEGFIFFKIKERKYFKLFKGRYFGVYKYNEKWDSYIVRAEDLFEFYLPLIINLGIICCIILYITVFCTIIGILFIRYLLRYIKVISSKIENMIENQELGIIDLKDATNDDVTYLGMAFNSLSSTINNLMGIFLKFVNKDIADKAYKEKTINLEGTKKDLTILFSDIRQFTYMTETLGIDIIKLLNIHYENVITKILNNDGVIGSIIGDALLAIFGSSDQIVGRNKSLLAIKAGYDIQKVTAQLRNSMEKAKANIEKNKGSLTANEKKVYKAVLIEIGVGIDGGDVFYGTIGSNNRMTNTVIGDNVNSSSRLESLTKLYKVPVICSEYVKNDIENNIPDSKLLFVELDMVQVKGKTIGKKIYWPIFEKDIDDKLRKNLNLFSEGLQLYYDGDWPGAVSKFKKSRLPFINVFLNRTENNECPKNWNGIWTMTTK